jgi:hypothetical protein
MLVESNLTIFSVLLMGTVELFCTECLVEIQTIQNHVKLKPFKKEDSDKEPWKVTAETSMLLKMASLNLVSSERVKPKENINHSELTELQFKKVSKMDNR